MQGHRFDIIEAYGCQPTTDFSIPVIFIVSRYLPLLAVAATAVFAGMIFITIACMLVRIDDAPGLSLSHFIKRRMSFAAHLSTYFALTTSLYLRLVFMSILQMFWSYTLVLAAMNLPLLPWTSWAEVHSDFSRIDQIDQYPMIAIPAYIDRNYHAQWWMVPAFFSFGRDAIVV